MSNITVISENNKTIIDSSELQRVTNISSSTVSAGGGSAWGSITGTLSDQTDLQAELDTKTGDQSDSEIKTAYENNADTNAFTDSEKTNLSNQSGTNTGDTPASGSQYEIQYSDGAGGFSASSSLVTDVNGGLFINTADILDSDYLVRLQENSVDKFFVKVRDGAYLSMGNSRYFTIANGSLDKIKIGCNALDPLIHLGAQGSVSFNPNDTISGVADTGLARDSAGALKITDGSTGDGDLKAKSLILPNGWSFVNTISNVLDIQLGGFIWHRFNSSVALELYTNTQVTWGASYGNLAQDTGIGRDSAGVVKITNGSTGIGELLYHKPLINISALHTAVATNHIINCTSNTFTVTLPTAVGIQGKEYIIKNSGSGVITVDADGTETIDGDLTQSLNQYDSLTIVSDNSNWVII